jgi:hypothetical protein
VFALLQPTNNGHFMKDYFSQFFSPLHNLSSHISQRFNNPLGLAFLFSWVVINWQALYYFLFNDGSAENKIKYLLMMYKVENIDKGDLGPLDSIIAWFKYTDNGTSLEHLLWSPLLAAILYVIFSPLLSNLVTGVWSILDKSCTSLRLKYVEKRTILTIDDKKAMYQALSEYEKDSQAKITELEETIESLKNSKQIELALKREVAEAERAEADAQMRSITDAAESADKVKKIASHGTGRTDFDVILRAVADTADKSKKDQDATDAKTSSTDTYTQKDKDSSEVKAGDRVLESADDLSKSSKGIVNSLNEDISHDNNDLNYYEHRTIVKKWFTVQAKQNKDLSELSEDEKDKIIHILAYLMTSGGAVSIKEMLRDISVSKVDFRQSINLLEAANIIYTSNVKVGINDKLLVDILAYSLK